MKTTFFRSLITVFLLTFVWAAYAFTPTPEYRYLQQEPQTMELLQKADDPLVTSNSPDEAPTNWTWVGVTALMGGMYFRFVHKK